MGYTYDFGCFGTTISAIFRPFSAVFGAFSPSWRQEARQHKRTAEKRRKTGAKRARNSGLGGVGIPAATSSRDCPNSLALVSTAICEQQLPRALVGEQLWENEPQQRLFPTGVSIKPGRITLARILSAASVSASEGLSS